MSHGKLSGATLTQTHTQNKQQHMCYVPCFYLLLHT